MHVLLSKVAQQSLKKYWLLFLWWPLKVFSATKKEGRKDLLAAETGLGLASSPPPFGREEVGGRPGCCSAPDLGQVAWLLDPSKPIRNAEA